jgi:cation diffusion facilitator CzcD-associated flavoprotein CzcO
MMVDHIALMPLFGRLSGPMAGEDTDLLIAGGGPAGMMAGLLFARAGLRVLVLEKHGDFLRDFPRRCWTDFRL